MLIRDSRKLHPEFDFDEACRIYAAAPADRDLRGGHVTSPYDLYSVEMLRDRLALRMGPAVTTDVFVFGKGEGPRRECTKVGGLPYWPAGRPWPKDSNGTPYRYLAQFNFTDSRDLVAELPADVLLLFVPEGDDWLFEPDRIHFEWLPVGLAVVPTIESSLVATTAGPFFGAIYRAADYPEAMPKAKTCWVHGRDEIAIINATKIGGLPYLIQDRDLDGEFLCQLNSIQAAPFAQYPWVNSPEPLGLEFGAGGIYRDENQFVMMDMGNTYIFRTKGGKVKSSIETY